MNIKNNQEIMESMEVFGAVLRALDPKDRRDLRRILRRLSDRVEEEVKKTERHLEQVAEGDAP